jgi:hypothetical protein
VSDGIYNIIYDFYIQRDGNHQTVYIYIYIYVHTHIYTHTHTIECQIGFIIGLFLISNFRRVLMSFAFFWVIHLRL